MTSTVYTYTYTFTYVHNLHVPYITPTFGSKCTSPGTWHYFYIFTYKSMTLCILYKILDVNFASACTLHPSTPICICTSKYASTIQLENVRLHVIYICLRSTCTCTSTCTSTCRPKRTSKLTSTCKTLYTSTA